MKKPMLFIIPIVLFLFSCCSREFKNPSISEPVVAKSVDTKTSKPIEASSRFSQSDAAIYFTVRIDNLPEKTALNAVWKYLGDGTEISSRIVTGGTGYEVFILKRSGSLFPAGQYEVTVKADAGGKSLEAKGRFSIEAELKTQHLVNPVTSKSVDGDENLNPVDETSIFSQYDDIIYFVVQSRDLPENSKVHCMWYYVDSGDILTHELVTGGSRNLAFNLKPEEGKSLPIGKYVVTATVTIDGEVESVSSKFEISDMTK